MRNTQNSDSSQICKVLQDVYKWHADHGEEMGFTTVIQDTLETGLDTTKLAGYIRELNATGFFHNTFLQNYRRVVAHTDYKLRNDTVKYLDEINFGFEDADPWTFFQDDPGNFWDSLVLRDVAIGTDTASLKWTLSSMAPEDTYLVRLKREQGRWKVCYMQGFDTTCCW
jgi:hypothetical protein